MNLKQNIIAKLNAQITSETFAGQQYLQMALWCDHRGMHGAAQFFHAHVPEESGHREKLIDYMIEAGAPVRIEAIPAPMAEFGNLVDVLNSAYAHEQRISAEIHAIAELCMDERDYSTFNMVQWFIAEQREEIVLFRGIVEHIELTGFKGEAGTEMVNMNRYLHALAIGDRYSAKARSTHPSHEHRTPHASGLWQQGQF